MPKPGFLFVNLGSPDAPTESDVRRYLNEFLMDGRVLDSPWPIRRMVVSCFILPKRPKESAEAYQQIWWDEGAPLKVISERVVAPLRERLDDPVVLSMRYQNPSIESGLLKLVEAGVDEVRMIPLYPHYAMSSVETCVVLAHDLLKKMAPEAELKVLPPFYDDPDYIECLVKTAEPHLAGDYDHLLFSYHGLPERHLRKGDPTGNHCLVTPDCCEVPSPAHDMCYRAQCFKTTRAFVEKAGIPAGKYSVAFQSRLGRDPWLTPATDQEVLRFAREGVKKMLVICPAFVSDCLETLEEIGMRAKEDFVEHGGESLKLIPCMNEDPHWIDVLEKWCREPARFQAPMSTPTTPF